MVSDARRRLLPAAWALGLAVVVLSVARWWLGRNDLPDGYQNEFIHLYTLGEIWFRVRDVGWGEAWPFLWDEYYPPLLHAPASLGMALFGRSRTVAVLSQALWVVPLLLAAVGMARRLAPGTAAPWLAPALLAFAPAVFGNLRRYEPNVALAACVALALLVLVDGPGLRDRRRAAVFGLVCALGLLVDRLVFAVYLVPPALLLLARHRRWRAWLLASVVTALGAGYYYARFLQLHLGEITSQLGGEVTATGEESATWGLLSLRGLLYYPLSAVEGFGLGLFLVLLVGLALHAARRRAGLADEPTALIEVTLVAGLALFTLLGKKQPYYAIPLLAPAAVLAAVGWAGRRRVALGALAAVVILGANQLAFLSTGSQLAPLPPVLAGASPYPERWLGHEYVLAGPPFEQELRLAEAARLCAGTGDGPTLLYSEGHGAYEGQVMPTLRLLLDTHRVPGLLMEPQAFEETLPRAACLVFVGESDWPEEAGIRATFGKWDLPPPSPELLAALAAARVDARELGRWTSDVGETVHVLALGAAPQPAPP